MNADLEAPLPGQHKVLARNVRLQQHKAWREAYEQRSGLADRTRSEIEEALSLRLNREFAACELLLVLFQSALGASRRRTICEPFPSFLCDSNGPLLDETVLHLSTLPPLKALAKSPELVRNLPLVVLKLVDWIVDTRGDGFSIVSVPVTDFMRTTAPKTTKRFQQAHTRPDYVFELVYENKSERGLAFEASKEVHGWLLAHHGSGLENFHSIARFGLCESFGRSTSIFGEGIYLSQDREVAYSFLKASEHGVRGLSTLGGRIGILTASEVILDPGVVRTSESPSVVASSLLEVTVKPLPPGYVVASAAHAVRTRYLLVTSDRACLASDEVRRRWRPSKESVMWALVLLYVLGLLLVWYWKSRPATKGVLRRATFMGLWNR